ncbi:MAG TPA: SRPBCC family protein [Steroidobacteraceae bacterium]|nr:SRPBCC family protein [Steroidobacteraceae bacterium]
MNRTIEIAPVRKSVVVEASPGRAFDVFTAGMDRWWPRSHAIGAAPLRESVLEPFVGGRWYTRHEDGSDVVVGHVRVWEPAARLVVSWEVSADWKPDPRPKFASEVEVRFTAEPGGRTRVDLEHRNFERMGAAAAEKMRKEVDGGWPTLLELFMRQVAKEGQKS